MGLEISSTLLQRLLEAAAETPDREVCGLLLGTPVRIEAMLPCRNVAPDPHVAFEIDPSQLIAAYRAERGGGPRIVGCYHSHPVGAPTPSARDAAAAAPDDWIWAILAEGGAGWYRAVEHGRLHGRFDPLRHDVTWTAAGTMGCTHAPTPPKEPPSPYPKVSCP